MPVHLPDTSRPRTTQLDSDFRRDPQTADFCVRCQKDFQPNQEHRWVFIQGRDFATVVHPEDVDAAVIAAGQGWHRIGIDCARKVGMEFTAAAPKIARADLSDALDGGLEPKAWLTEWNSFGRGKPLVDFTTNRQHAEARRKAGSRVTALFSLEDLLGFLGAPAYHGKGPEVSYELADRIAEQMIAELLLQDNAWSAEYDEGEHLLVPPDANGLPLAMTLPLHAAINKVLAGLITQQVRLAADTARTAFLRDVDANDQIGALNRALDAAFAVALGSARPSGEQPIDLSDIPEVDESLFARGKVSKLRRNLRQAQPQVGEGIRVMPLRWQRRGDDWFADSLVGRYEVGIVHSGYVATLRQAADEDAGQERIAASGSGAEQVMAACQGDLERRVLAVLEARQ